MARGSRALTNIPPGIVEGGCDASVGGVSCLGDEQGRRTREPCRDLAEEESAHDEHCLILRTGLEADTEQ